MKTKKGFKQLAEELENLYEQEDDVAPIDDPGAGIEDTEPMADEEPSNGDESKVITLTPEGRRMLIDTALQALSIDPDNLTQYEKSIFNDEVTAENAEDILSEIQRIIEEY